MKEMTLVRRQLYGAIGIVVVVLLGSAVREILQYVCLVGTSVGSCEYETDGMIVGLAGDVNHDGFYTLPPRATVYDLFKKTGMRDRTKFRESDLAIGLHSGDRVVCDRACYRLTIDDIDVPTRLALGMPIDLNAATQEDLVLVPGIGRKTASEIIRLRDEEGGFSSIDLLRRIDGMGEKRYHRVKDYLYVRPSYP